MATALCLTNSLQLRRDKSLVIWKQFSICIICPVHGAFAKRNPSHTHTQYIYIHTQKTIKRKKSEANRDLRQQWRVAEESP